MPPAEEPAAEGDATATPDDTELLTDGEEQGDVGTDDFKRPGEDDSRTEINILTTTIPKAVNGTHSSGPAGRRVNRMGKA